MSVPVVLTREYLQGLPEANRLKKIKEEEDRKAKTVTAIVEYFRGNVLDAASKEKTSYLVEGSKIEELRNVNPNQFAMGDNNTDWFRQKLQQKIFTNKFTDEDVVAGRAVCRAVVDEDSQHARHGCSARTRTQFLDVPAVGRVSREHGQHCARAILGGVGRGKCGRTPLERTGS
jgi:hypothetical protein